MSTIHDLEQLRRSLVMAPGSGPATALSNQEAANLIARLIVLEQLRTGVSDLLTSVVPVPRANAQLRRLCSDLARLLASGEQAVTGPTPRGQRPLR